MTRSYFKPLLGCSLPALLAVLASHGAHAQSAPGKQSMQIQEIVITAEKKSENLQKAAISVDALRPSDIAKAGIKNAVDLQQLLPAVKFVTADEMTVSIRGLGTTDDNAGVDSAVAYSQDGIYLDHPEAMTPVLFDLARVEAVLGPQGTLYGRNSNAGAINFVTNNPVFKYAGEASIGIGNYGEVDSDAMINIPLSDELALRIAEGSQRHNAYDSAGTNSADNIAGRAKLLYKPNNDFSFLLDVDVSQQKVARGVAYDASCAPHNGLPGCAGTPYVPWSGLSPTPLSGHNSDYVFGVNGTLNYNMGWANLISLTGYKQYQFSSDSPAPWTGGVDSFDYLRQEVDRNITQEVRISNETGSRIQWVGGVYFSHEDQPGITHFNYWQNTILQFLSLAPNNYYEALGTTKEASDSQAVFADVTVPLIEGLNFNGGLRYTHETKTFAGFVGGGVWGVATFPNVPTANTETQSRVTWKAKLSYDITPQNMVYAQSSTGFKSGGVNNLPAAATGLLTYAPETILAYEIGSKNRFFDGRLQVNADAFHYDYHGYQTYLFYQPNSGPLVGSTLFPTVNSQTATFEGGELDVRARVTAVDTLGFNLQLLHDVFDKYIISLPNEGAAPLTPLVTNNSNTSVFLAPKATYSMSYEHDFIMPNEDILAVGADSTVVMSHLAQGIYYQQPTYHKTGAHISYETAESGWTVTAYIRNIENVAVINSIAGGFPVMSNIGENNVYIDPPRTFGFNVKKVF